jgi:hypothetical protein
MLELLDERLKEMEDIMKDFNPDKDISRFSASYGETIAFLDTTYIFLRCLLDDIAGIIEWFYKLNEKINLPSSFFSLLKKSQKRTVSEELILLLESCQEWFLDLKEQRDRIIHKYETKLIGFVLNKKDGDWTTVHLRVEKSDPGVGIRASLGVVLRNYQCFVDDLLDFWDRRSLRWYGIVLSRNSRAHSILQGRTANMLFWATRYGGYHDAEMIITP